MATRKTRKITFTDAYSGRAISCRVKWFEDFEEFSDDNCWTILSDYQRKKIEDFFGKMAAYYTKAEYH